MEIRWDDQADTLSEDPVCTVCFAEFLDIEDLQMHLTQVHANDVKNRFCKICTRVFSDIETYALHLRNDHLSNLKCCKYCTRLFGDANELHEHQKKHRAAVLYPKISCSHCQDIFKNKTVLERHEFRDHREVEEGLVLKECLPILSSLVNMNIRKFLVASYSNIPYTCAKCSISTADISEYLQHLLDYNCRSLACNECCNIYSERAKLVAHMHKHINVNNLLIEQKEQCNKCKKFFKPHLYKFHEKKCIGMSCLPCDATFNSLNEYSHHLSEHAKSTLPLEVCVYCQRQLVGPVAMAKHVERSHKHEIHLYKYHCNDCDRIFKHPKYLFAHFFTRHKDLHPYTCKICNLKFRIRKNFTLHIKLDHKSVGFVEFDDHFHVSFTDKRSKNVAMTQNVLEAINTNNVVEPKEKTNTYAQNCEESDGLIKEKCKTGDQTKSSDKALNYEVPENITVELQPEDLETYSEGKYLETKDDNKDIENIEVDETDSYLKEMSSSKQKQKKNVKTRKRKIKSKQTNKRNDLEAEYIEDFDELSDDSDVPLQSLVKKVKLAKRTPWNKRFQNLKKQNRKFMCPKCNRNCYTYQNYHRHKALHFKHETKVCVKCQAKFTSVKELNEHVRLEHSTSKLTETLKKVIEKRKTTEKTIIKSEKTKEILNCSKQLTTSEMFRNTVKKVNYEVSRTKVTIKPVDADKISVKKFLESFSPENNDVKVTMVPRKSCIKRQNPLIKLTKFTNISTPDSPVSLKMPIKFIDTTNIKCNVSIQLVQNVEAQTMDFNNETKVQYDQYDQYAFDDQTTYDNVYDDYETSVDIKDAIPEVAEEVSLVGTEETSKVLHTLNIKDLKKRDEIAIAHLSSEAPYFKISKIKNLSEKEGQTFVLDEEEKPVESKGPIDITLPSGKKLVNVNPFAHLLSKETIEEVLKARKPKHPYYKPKLKNITEAITKAMGKLDEIYS